MMTTLMITTWRRSAPGFIALILWALAGEASSSADEPPDKTAFQRFKEQDYMLGTWGGLRTALSDHGVDLEFFYLGSLPSNVKGGIRTGSAYEGLMLMSLDLTSDKLIGYHGGDFHVGSLWLHGHDHFSDRYVGDLNFVNLVDYPNAFRLWEMWYSQKFFSDKATVKFGALCVDGDFLVRDYYNNVSSLSFINNTFFYPTMLYSITDNPGFPVGHHGLALTPYTAPGIVLRADPTEEWYAQAGVYGGDPDTSYHGTEFKLSEDAGALIQWEAGYKLSHATNETGLPGSYKVGAYYHTDGFFDVYGSAKATFAGEFGGTANTPRERSGNYGGYFLAEQYLWLEQGKSDPAMQGLIGFFRIAGAPANRNLTQFGVDGGLVFKGLIPSRDRDTLGIAASYLEISDAYTDAVRDANKTYGRHFRLPDYEGVLEVSYKAQLTPWWTVQPSLQWVLHPGGLTDLAKQNSDAVAVVVQTTLTF